MLTHFSSDKRINVGLLDKGELKACYQTISLI